MEHKELHTEKKITLSYLHFHRMVQSGSFWIGNHYEIHTAANLFEITQGGKHIFATC